MYQRQLEPVATSHAFSPPSLPRLCCQVLHHNDAGVLSMLEAMESLSSLEPPEEAEVVLWEVPREGCATLGEHAPKSAQWSSASGKAACCIWN
mmetsp:Transcript_58871/g.137083  ORF Transcript_58871/g.137083 Transcript_58871/m.137083 type:complete len:93 (-) Transcript_58871:1462-1740(-)